MPYTFIVRGSRRAEQALKDVEDSEEIWERATPKVGEYLRAHTRAVFESQGRRIGEKWPGYTGEEAQYGAIKRKMLGPKLGSLKLRWEPGVSERLFPSLTKKSHPDHVFAANAGSLSWTFGTRVPYAANHQEGVGTGPSWAGSGSIKKRPFLRLQERDVAEIRRIYSRAAGLAGRRTRALGNLPDGYDPS